MWLENKWTTECDNDIVICNVGTTQCNVGHHPMWVKKIIEPPNVTKVKSYVILVLHNLTMELSNVSKKKKGIAEYNKSIVICDVGIV